MGAADTPSYAKHGPWRPSDILGSFADSTAEDVALAVDAAATARHQWAQLPAVARGTILENAADLVRDRADVIASDLTSEMGKPISQAKGEVLRSAAILRYYAGEALRPVGEMHPPTVARQRLYTLRRPVGIVGLITPWNFPIAIPTWKLAPALIHGNTVVLKLARESPRTGLHLAEALTDAGLPAGVLNVVTGSGSTTGGALVAHSEVRAISFTGSVPVGHLVREQATARGCRVQLELGGHNPLIVMPDADFDRAVEAAFVGAYLAAGQRCTATRRMYVHTDIYPRFRDALVARIDRAVVGDPHDARTEVGPLVSESAMNDVLAAIDRGREEGGRILAGGARVPSVAGHLVAPTLFEDVAEDAYLSCEEVFGPVASLYSFTDVDDALERANGVPFGLSAALFTRDLELGLRFAQEAQAGVIHINSETTGADIHVPFGGLKDSGWGPHEQGRSPVDFFTDVVTVYENA